MPAIILPDRWKRQPNSPARLNRRNPLSPPVSQTSFLWFPNRDLISQATPSTGGSGSEPTTIATSYGLAVYSSGKYLVSGMPAHSTSTATFMMAFTPDSAPTSGNYNSAFQNNQYTFNWNHVDTAYQGSITLTNNGAYPTCKFTSGFTAGVRVVVAGTYDGTTLKVYRNGIIENSISVTPYSVSSTPVPMQFIGGQGGTANWAGACDFFLWRTDRALSAAEIKAASDNIYDFAEKPPRILYFPSAGPVSAPTLSAANVGSITSTSAVPQVAVTFA